MIENSGDSVERRPRICPARIIRPDSLFHVFLSRIGLRHDSHGSEANSTCGSGKLPVKANE